MCSHTWNHVTNVDFYKTVLHTVKHDVHLSQIYIVTIKVECCQPLWGYARVPTWPFSLFFTVLYLLLS